jgi:hypothetical protein
MVFVLVAALVALAGLLLLDVLNLGHPVLNPLAHMASYSVHARAGWLLVVVGLACAASAFALVPALRRGRVPVVVFGVGLLVAGVVPTQPYGQWDDQSLATTVHGLAGWAAFIAVPLAAWRLRRDAPAWPGAAAATLVVLLLLGTIDSVGDGPDLLGHVLGLVERLLIAAELLWLVLAARAVRRT